ncbi:MAG TPA: aldose 1-epimerase [Flavobacteriaceae bacterium]
MFSVNHIQDQKNGNDFIELRNSDNSCCAKIDLTLGGSLQELKFGEKAIISTKDMLPYNTMFKSSILFPFANRIENGCYHFNNKKFKLDKSEIDSHNAIHGLVHDKTFRFIGQEISEKKASAILSYEETQPVLGFPFKYDLILEYVLTNESLRLNVEIKNKDQQAFPFSLGWHPYFKTDDLYNSRLKINSHKKILVNDKMIPNGETDIDWNGFLKIEDKAFDDCFELNTNMVELKTPEYHLDFSFSSEENYLQLYTPNDRKSIAIEPQTAPANSFNTKVGLKILQPDERYQLSWKLNLK